MDNVWIMLLIAGGAGLAGYVLIDRGQPYIGMGLVAGTLWGMIFYNLLG